MKVLFVCSGNLNDFSINPFIKAQGDSLEKAGLEITYFPIIGKGVMGYINGGIKLRKYLKKHDFDLIHAHFSLSGWSALIGAGKIPVVLSLMGDDAQGDYIGVNKIRFGSRLYMFLTFLIQPFVDAIISKAQNIESYVYLKSKSYIIPNGINIKLFKPIGAMEFLKLKTIQPGQKQQVMFLGSQKRIGKNFPLAQKAVRLLNNPNVKLTNPFPIPHDAIPEYLKQADVLAFPSFMEGSPNLIKEAMACNCPIVATDVGDIRWVFGDTEGCFLSTHDPGDFSLKLKMALSFAKEKGRTQGSRRIAELGLDSESVALRIIKVYNKVLRRENLPEAAAKTTLLQPDMSNR